MNKLPNLDKLNEAIDIAEKVIEKERNNKSKIKRINKALDKAYALLNRDSYTQREVDNCTSDIWNALRNKNDALVVLLFLFSFLLSGALFFTALEISNFLQENWNPSNDFPILNEETSKLITVNYKETNIVNLENLMTVSDDVGLKNTPQTFEISNDSSKVGGLNYKVNYSINIVELNDKIERVLDKKYLKFQLSYVENGQEIVTPIKTFADLKKNPDGSFLLMNGTQKKDGITSFKVVIWLSADAPNEEQNTAYMFAFKVSAVIAKP